MFVFGCLVDYECLWYMLFDFCLIYWLLLVLCGVFIGAGLVGGVRLW